MTQCVIHYLSKMDPLHNIQETLITIFQAGKKKCLLIFLKQLHKNMWQTYIHVLSSKYTQQHNIFLTIIVPRAL